MRVQLSFVVINAMGIANFGSAFVPLMTRSFVDSRADPASSAPCLLFLAEDEEISSDTSWIQSAMGNDATSNEEEFRTPLPLTTGVAGFAVDPKLGFCVVLAGPANEKQRATYGIIAPSDRDRLSSPEALTMVQLAGGLDLGTVILPPDALARLAADELDTSPQDIQKSIVTLIRVEALPNTEPQVSNKQSKQETMQTPSSSPERDAAITGSAPKIVSAVKNLPGLTDCSLDEVLVAMQQHADVSGSVNRDAFLELLQTLRNNKFRTEPSKVDFLLTVSVVGAEGGIQHVISAPTFPAVGLALRYGVPITIAEECLGDDGFEASDIDTIFPAFRPIQELAEDAKVMDGFIPTMFAKAGPKNDQKL
jgi:bifunctional DNase/RNase